MRAPLARPRPVWLAEPGRCVDAIIERVGRRIVLALPLGLGKANHVANALFQRAAADRGIELEILTALTLEKPRGGPELQQRLLDPIVARLFGDYPSIDAEASAGAAQKSRYKERQCALQLALKCGLLPVSERPSRRLTARSALSMQSAFPFLWSGT